jgi:hypothetical protein
LNVMIEKRNISPLRGSATLRCSYATDISGLWPFEDANCRSVELF